MRVYLHIASELENQIKQHFLPGDYLEPESKLAAQFEVNRHTVRRAIDELVSAGLIQRHQGKGNMVLAQPKLYPLHAGAHFTGNLLDQGSQPSCEVLKSRVIKASTKIAQQFGLPEDSKVIHIQTLRTTEQTPRCVIDHYLADVAWWPQMKQFKSGSLHLYLKQHFGFELERKKTRLRAQSPSNEECRLLQINHSIPILKIKTINVIKGSNTVVEFSSSHLRSDLTELVMEHK